MVQERDGAGEIRAGDGVADAVERDLGAFLLREQRLFHGVALDRVAERAHEPAWLDLPLDEVVLRAFLQRLRRQRLVVAAGQHDEWDARRRGVGPADGVQSFRVDQAEIEQDEVDRVLREMPLPIRHALDVGHVRVVRTTLVEHLAEQTSVSRVVFDQEQRGDGVRAHLRCSCWGSLAYPSQNVLMLCTRSQNASNCCGLQR